MVKLSGKTKVYGVIGYPIEHSLSPVFQNIFFSRLGIDAVYVPFSVPPEDLQTAIEGLKALGVKGVNVTIPHKERVLQFVDFVDEHVEKIGSSNTLKFVDGKVYAYNTDWIGFLKAVQGLIEPGKRVLLLGAGGAARAVLYALLQRKDRVFIFNRSKEKAYKLAETFGAEVIDRPEDVLKDVDLIVNATSVGLVDKSWLFDYTLIEDRHVVYDIVYGQTELIRRAKSKGAKCEDGLSMLVHQGAESFKIWTGMEVPQDLVDECIKTLRESWVSS
ncbi:shikimate dehydrogenase [Thermocrinis minervae]|uniref:Shikimate dehydrogenase (NADP(+)) n=1 Tax=Thermocrinis minervae TaxID=381751 RepID=A0A1M6QZN1_9AQUI|nr:shikimate dehydrogenase [Thermocrinis minervae]SHK25548.1 shikimate dehydrogenase [Thermocrinis minervae]